MTPEVARAREALAAAIAEQERLPAYASAADRAIAWLGIRAAIAQLRVVDPIYRIGPYGKELV